MKTKYYVWNDKIQVLVVASSPIEAVSAALKYCNFHDSTEIPEKLISWPIFYVDMRGFRDKLELIRYATDIKTGLVSYEEIQEGAGWAIDKIVALDYFDGHYATELNEDNSNDEFWGDFNI